MSATWDSKGIKITPVSADEVLIIDTEDSRNQKRATILSLPFGITTSNVGTGEGLALPPVLNDFPFKSLIGTAPIVLTGNADNITFTLNALTNTDLATGIFSNITGVGVQTQDLDLAGKLFKNVGNGDNDSLELDVQQIVAKGTRTQRFVMFRNQIVNPGTNIGNFRARSLDDEGLVEINYVQFIFTVEDPTASATHGSASLRVEHNASSTPFISLNLGKSGDVKLHRPTDLSNNRIKNLGNPVNAQDAETKKHAEDTFVIPATNTVHVKSMSDFPDPVNGVITWTVDTTYIIDTSLVTSDRFINPDQSSVFLTSGNANVSLTRVGSATDAFISSADDATGGLVTITSLDVQSSGSSTLFNLKNQGLDVFRAGLFNFADMGIIRDCPFIVIRFGLVLFMGQGLRILNSAITDIHKVSFANLADSNQPYLTIVGNNPGTSISGNLFTRFPNESVVFFDPNLVSSGGGTVIADNGGSPGEGFFKVGTNASITAFADSDVDPGVKTKVTSIAHGLIDGEAAVITGAPNNNGTFLISNVTTDTFDIENVFSVNDATGTWDTSSLDETDILIRVRDVAFQKPSFSIAEARHDTDTTTVVDTIGQIVVLGGTDWTQGENTEEWTVDSNGLTTYIGLEPKKFKFDGRNIVSKVGGGSDEIQTGFKINGVNDITSFVPVDNNGPALSAPAEIRTFKTGDNFQVIGRNQSSTKDIQLHSGSKVLVTTV